MTEGMYDAKIKRTFMEVNNMKKLKIKWEYLLETIDIIKDCRRRYRRITIVNGEQCIVNVKFLAHIASIPEWTITIFNKPRLEES